MRDEEVGYVSVGEWRERKSCSWLITSWVEIASSEKLISQLPSLTRTGWHRNNRFAFNQARRRWKDENDNIVSWMETKHLLVKLQTFEKRRVLRVGAGLLTMKNHLPFARAHSFDCWLVADPASFYRLAEPGASVVMDRCLTCSSLLSLVESKRWDG